jgi:hypothetical protein
MMTFQDLNKFSATPAEIVSLRCPERDLSISATAMLIQRLSGDPNAPDFASYEAHGQFILPWLAVHVVVPAELAATDPSLRD